MKEATPRGAAHKPNTHDAQQNESASTVNNSTDPSWNAGMNNFNPAQMAQLYTRMMQMSGGGMGMGGMGMGMGNMGMGMGMMNPMMMNGGMGMGSMNMGMMNPMAAMGGAGMMGYGAMGGMGMNPRAAVMPPAAAAAAAVRGRAPGAAGPGGPNRAMNRGANSFHPYAR